MASSTSVSSVDESEEEEFSARCLARSRAREIWLNTVATRWIGAM